MTYSSYLNTQRGRYKISPFIVIVVCPAKTTSFSSSCQTTLSEPPRGLACLDSISWPALSSFFDQYGPSNA